MVVAMEVEVVLAVDLETVEVQESDIMEVPAVPVWLEDMGSTTALEEVGVMEMERVLALAQEMDLEAHILAVMEAAMEEVSDMVEDSEEALELAAAPDMELEVLEAAQKEVRADMEEQVAAKVAEVEREVVMKHSHGTVHLILHLALRPVLHLPEATSVKVEASKCNLFDFVYSVKPDLLQMIQTNKGTNLVAIEC